MKNSVMFLAGCLLAASCRQLGSSQSEAELSAFGTYVDSLDSTVEGEWFTRMGVSADADSMLSYLRRELPRNGLDTTAFFLPQIAEDLWIVHTLAFDSVGQSIGEVLKRLDGNLSKAYIDYTAGQRFGFMRPDKVLNRLDYKVGGSGYARLFDYEVKAPDYDESRRQMSTDDRMGYLVGSQPQDYVYRALQACLDTARSQSVRRKIAVNMERCRWQMDRPERQDRHILVNIPAQLLWAVGGDSVLDMRICCGAFPTKTPLLHSSVNLIQVNPEWIIPYNIVKSDVARHAGDSAYFARNHYSIIDRRSSDTLKAGSVTSDQLLSGNYRVVQAGGAGNSLGRIVVRFPNNFSVYLHDTNNRGAFQRDRRTLSHGCVRVQKPFELACYMLPDADDWMKDRLRISMDIAPETDRGRDYLKEHSDDDCRPLRLINSKEVSPRIPVYIVYFTAYPNPSTGKMELWPDRYEYDQAITKEISSFLLK